MSAKLQRFLVASFILTLTWLAMAGSLAWPELTAGVLLAMAVSFLALPRLQHLDGLRLTPGLPLHVLHYLLVFFRALIASNLDMAKRILSPKLPINPAIIEVDTQLRSPLGRLLLANSITLTPGTLTVDVEEQRLRVHWIDARGATDLHTATRLVAERFEIPLRRFVR